MYETEYARQADLYYSDRIYKSRNQHTKCCNSCGRSDLHWGHTQSGWRLFTPAGLMHDCRNLRRHESRGPTMNKVLYELEKVKSELRSIKHVLRMDCDCLQH